jgi:hyperosmotically inducible periplasmic protein
MRRPGVRTGGFAAALLLAAVPLAAQKRQPAGRPLPSGEDPAAREVRHELLMLPAYRVFDSLAFSMSGGTVTLTGQVTQPVLKREAEDVVKRIEGVARVENRIHVLPASEVDWQVRRAVYGAIYGDPNLSSEYGYRALPPIHIIVENGHATLVGAVGSEAHKNLAGVLANRVPGVFSVANDLAVDK